MLEAKDPLDDFKESQLLHALEKNRSIEASNTTFLVTLDSGLDQAITGFMEHEVYHGLERLLAKRRSERRELIVGMEHYL